jgi:hypothetical protein
MNNSRVVQRGTLAAERALLRDAVAAREAMLGGRELFQDKDPPVAFQRSLLYERGAQHRSGILERLALEGIQCSPLEQGAAAEAQERNRKFSHR